MILFVPCCIVRVFSCSPLLRVSIGGSVLSRAEGEEVAEWVVVGMLLCSMGPYGCVGAGIVVMQLALLA